MHTMRSLPLLLTGLLTSSLCAQITDSWTIINRDGVGCQGNEALLTGGVEASANLIAVYDQSTGVLLLTVENTSLVVPGQSNPVIAGVHLNLPNGAITSASLVSQSANGATPAFSLSFDNDTASGPSPNDVACFGNFNLSLTLAGAQGAIANANAPLVTAPSPIVGPVTFELQLAGPGSSGINAEAIVVTATQAGSVPANVGAEFRNGGASGTEAGYLGSCDICRTALYTVGDTSPGQTFFLCATGTYGCHACIWASAIEGPVTIGGVTLPIGLPLEVQFTLGNFGLGGAGNSFCVPVAVPNNQQLVGYEFYAANVTFYALQIANFDFSPAVKVRIE